MKILHYSLGFPPYRTGGLVKFCIDLMEYQKNNDIEVAMLWPGRIRKFFSDIDIIEKIDSNTGLMSYELINPLPVPLDEGIQDLSMYTHDVDKNFYIKILSKIKPDIIHIHTLMGIHKSFFSATKEMGIKTIYTTHDYFGLCPKLTFFYNNKVCNGITDLNECTKCNETALSKNKIYISQSPIYRKFKNNLVVRIIRKKHRRKFFLQEENNKRKNMGDNSDIYRKLRLFYIDLFKQIDVFHFNSNLSKDIFLKFFVPKEYYVINLTHKKIADNRKIKKSGNTLKITYMASVKPYKGFYILIEALDRLFKSSNKDEFVLNVYANTEVNRKYIKIYGEYDSSELYQIFENTDLLIVPSIWYETYGYTVLEAISHGVPVVVTENVGAKDIVKNAGIIIKPNNIDDLANCIQKIIDNRDILSQMNMETFNCILPKMDDLKVLWEG